VVGIDSAPEPPALATLLNSVSRVLLFRVLRDLQSMVV
jgi:hypothetical protein